MAIKRMIVFECDECGENLDTETDDFDEAKEIVRESGWRIRKEVGGDWVHFCSGCARG